jgi:hypothetical protein
MAAEPVQIYPPAAVLARDTREFHESRIIREPMGRVQHPQRHESHARASPEDPDSELVSRLRAGDEGAFAEPAGKYQGAMMSMARGYVPLTVHGTSERVAVAITWARVHVTRGEPARPVARADQLSYWPRQARSSCKGDMS